MTEACTAARFRQFLTSIDSVLFSKNEQGVDFPADTKRKLFANKRPRGRSPHGLWRHCPLRPSEDSVPERMVPYDTACPAHAGIAHSPGGLALLTVAAQRRLNERHETRLKARNSAGAFRTSARLGTGGERTHYRGNRNEGCRAARRLPTLAMRRTARPSQGREGTNKER